MSSYAKENIIRRVAEEDIQFIRMQFTDIFGQLKNVAITASQIEKAYPARTIGEKIAEARQQSGAEKLKEHDIMALERFDPEVRHMIVFDVLSYDSPVGDKGDKMRLFLTDTGYQKFLESLICERISFWT